MRKILFLSVLLITASGISNAQEQQKKSRREIREERQAKKIKEIRTLLEERTYVFTPTHAMPMGGGSIHLNFSFDAEINKDTINSYLPFFGVAYRAEYGARRSALDFIQPVTDYRMEKDKDGYQINFEVKNKMDNLIFTFHISETGYATLNVISTDRQAISYYGRIEAPEPEQNP